MNSRHLTSVPSDFEDPLPLTANPFLLGRITTNFPRRLFLDSEITISKSCRTAQK